MAAHIVGWRIVGCARAPMCSQYAYSPQPTPTRSSEAGLEHVGTPSCTAPGWPAGRLAGSTSRECAFRCGMCDPVRPDIRSAGPARHVEVSVGAGQRARQDEARSGAYPAASGVAVCRAPVAPDVPGWVQPVCGVLVLRIGPRQPKHACLVQSCSAARPLGWPVSLPRQRIRTPARSLAPMAKRNPSFPSFARKDRPGLRRTEQARAALPCRR